MKIKLFFTALALVAMLGVVSAQPAKCCGEKCKTCCVDGKKCDKCECKGDCKNCSDCKGCKKACTKEGAKCEKACTKK